MLNWVVDGLFVLVGLAIIFSGAKRGLIKSVIHFFKTLLAFFAAYLWGSALGAFLRDRFIAEPVRSFVYDKFNGLYTQAAEGFDAQAALGSLPQFLQTEEVRAKLASAEGTGEALVNSMTDAVATPIATVFSNILGYVLVVLLAIVVLSIGAAILTHVIESWKLLDRLNTILGAVLGLLVAAVVLLAAASVIKFFFGNAELYTNSIVVRFLGDSGLLKALSFLDLGGNWFADLLG